MIDFRQQPLQHWPSWRPAFLNDLHKLRNITKIGYQGVNWVIGFGQGRFDDWAAIAIMTTPDGRVWQAYSCDDFYFELALRLEVEHAYYNPNLSVFRNIWKIYEKTTNEFDTSVIDMIHRISAEYGSDSDIALTCFSHIYYGMIAEENKKNTKIGRLIKMVGLYQMLHAGMPITQATGCLCTQAGNPDTGWDVIYAKALYIGLVRPLTNTSDEDIAAVHAGIRDAVIDGRPYTSIFNTGTGTAPNDLPPADIY